MAKKTNSYNIYKYLSYVHINYIIILCITNSIFKWAWMPKSETIDNSGKLKVGTEAEFNNN